MSVSMPPHVPRVELHISPLRSHIDLWVERDVLEIVLSAAFNYACYFSLVEDWKQQKVIAAIEEVQKSVQQNTFDKPLNVNRL